MKGSFDSKKLPEGFIMVGVTIDQSNLAKVNPKYPKTYDASFVTLVDQSATDEGGRDERPGPANDNCGSGHRR